MESTSEDGLLLDTLAAIRPGQTDLLARSLHDAIRHSLVGAPGAPFCLGRFTVLGRLGGGGMGTVFVAYDPDLDRKIALKVLHSRGEHGRQAALREGRALARLKHPNVVTVYEVAVLDEHVCVAMEYVSGCDLRAWLRGSPSRAQILERLVEAGRGLAAAHDVDLVHRDFKPENVVIDGTGHARVIDFGLARALDELAPSVRDHGDGRSDARTSHHGGTPAYMAPERLAGAAGDRRSDQYAFCLTCCEALFGERRIGSPGPGVSARTVRALRRGLQAAPEARFPSMHALLAALVARPARVWARGLLAAAAVGVALGGYVVGQREHAGPRCVSPWQQLAGTWSPARADAIGAAFAATGAPFARHTWASARATIDRYARAWTDAHASACHETAVLGVASTETYGRRVLCLADRRLHLAALLDRFAEADLETVTRALHAIDGLPAADACARPDVAGPLPSGDPAAVHHRLALRDQLARGRAEVLLGRINEAGARIERLIVEARAGADQALLAEALHLASVTDKLAGRPGPALLRIREALRLALEQAQPLLAARATLALVMLYQERLDGGAAIDELLRAAEALLRAAGDPPQLRLELLIVRGTELRHARRHVEAIATQMEARALALELEIPHLAAMALMNAGNAHDALGDHAAAQHALEQARVEYEASLGPLHPAVAKVHSNLGNVALSAQRYDDAIPHIERSLAITRVNFGEDHPLVAIAHLHLGTVHGSHKRREDALAEHRLARAVFEKVRGPRHPHVALATCAVGFELHKLGHLEAARVELDRSSALQAELLPPTDCDRLYCTALRGGLLRDLGRHAEAVATLEEALTRANTSTCAERLQGDVELELAQTLWASQGARARTRILGLLASIEPWLVDDARAAADRLRAALR